MGYQLNFTGLAPYFDHFVSGLWTTIELTVIATTLGITLGIVGAGVRTGQSKALKPVVACAVEVIRNTPFIVQLFFIFFGLPALGIKISAWQAGILAMVINLGAYSTEIIRAGIEAIPKGQFEASRTLGLTRLQVFRYIVVPQAIQKISPALISQCIIVMLGSSVVSQISVEELTFSANFVQSRNFLSFESYFVTTAIYLLLAIAMRAIMVRSFNRLFGSAAVGSSN